jgi:hypothetical protein
VREWANACIAPVVARPRHKHFFCFYFGMAKEAENLSASAIGKVEERIIRMNLFFFGAGDED